MVSKQALSSRLAIVGLIGLLAFFGQIKYKQWQSQKAIDEERGKLQAQADDLQKKNSELNESLKYLNSPSFKERVARQQLGLKRDGETVYSFSEQQVLGQSTTQVEEEKEINFKKWWDYFFSE